MAPLALPKDAVKAASRVPAFALVIVMGVIVLAVATQTELALAIVIVVLFIFLGAFAIWIEKRSISPETREQKERLETVQELDAPIRAVFDCLVADEDDVYVVYSSTMVEEFVDQRGHTVRPDDLAYGGAAEKRVTTIPDARGVALIHKLLYLGGKRDKVWSVTAWDDDFRQEWWDSSLILIGSGKSNQITTETLNDFNSPYRFSEDLDSIVDVTKPGTRWPANKSDLEKMDYGLVVKLKVERTTGTSVYLVIAGVGPYGTLAGCIFLDRCIEDVLYARHKHDPFAYVLSVRRGSKGEFVPKIEGHYALPIVRP